MYSRKQCLASTDVQPRKNTEHLEVRVWQIALLACKRCLRGEMFYFQLSSLWSVSPAGISLKGMCYHQLCSCQLVIAVSLHFRLTNLLNLCNLSHILENREHRAVNGVPTACVQLQWQHHKEGGELISSFSISQRLYFCSLSVSLSMRCLIMLMC